MTYRITTLAENLVYGKGLQGEHGLSLFVETPDCRLLFDTGASDLFIHNARLLGIDLSQVDYLILSHGHRDHTGGLRHFLKVNSKAKVICKKEIFYRKFKNDRENGMRSSSLFDQSRFQFVNRTTEIVPGVYVYPEWPITDPTDTHFEQFLIEKNGNRCPDTFEDELALVLKSDHSVSVLSACSHRGITNILRVVRADYPQLPFDLVLGGFHIRMAGDSKYAPINAYLKQYTPKRLGVCHCTGVDQYALFHRDFEQEVFYNHTGWVETIK